MPAGREQMGLVLKALSGIYLILISQKLRDRWLDTYCDRNSRIMAMKSDLAFRTEPSSLPLNSAVNSKPLTSPKMQFTCLLNGNSVTLLYCRIVLRIRSND